MRIVITYRQALLDPDLAPWLTRRLLLALSRYAPRIARVTASIREDRHPRPARRHTCRLALRLASGQRLALEAHDDRLDLAVGRAIARLQLQVARRLRDERTRPLHMPAPRCLRESKRSRPAIANLLHQLGKRRRY